VVCAVTQNPFVAVMPAGNSPERARMMRGLGAEVVVTPQVDGTPGKVTGKDIEAALERARGIARERNGFLVDQFRNPATFLAHEETTGPEIWAETRGEVDAFVAMVGSGGTFVGTSRFLKGRNPAIVCAAVEPEGAEFLAGKTVAKPAHLLQGAGYAMTPLDWPDGLADLFLAVSDAEAGEMRAELGRREGLYVGFTAAANVCAARKLLESGRLRREAMVVTILCDTGLKYTG
jgi:cysteine synthase A